MNTKGFLTISLVAAATLLVACDQQSGPGKPVESGQKTADVAVPSPSSEDSTMPQDMQMPMEEKPISRTHSGTGTVTAVDGAAGTVTLAHEPVASANWPAMTMTFKLADPKQAKDLHANDHVQFTFTIGEKNDVTVTSIARAAH